MISLINALIRNKKVISFNKAPTGNQKQGSSDSNVRGLGLRVLGLVA